MKTLTTEQMKRTLERGDALVINVLDREHFERVRIPGTRNVPLSDDGFVERVDALAESRDQALAVYCAGPDCSASPKAASALEEAGFADVSDYEGGVEEWAAAGHEVERAETAGVH